MNYSEVIGFLTYILKVLFLATSNNSRWMATLLWVARLVTFSLILRTYIVPFLLARMSNHIRIRSISFRSIRGLYVRKGILIWRIDRIGMSYRWSSVEGHSRLSLKIEGLKLEVGKADPRLSSLPFRGRRRNKLSLADFAPSPVAHRIWLLISSIYSFVEPSLRPLVRTYVVASLRLLIRFLPVITQALDFDLSSAMVTLSELPGTKIVTDDAKLHISLAFTQLDSVLTGADREPQKRVMPTKQFSVAAWKSRLKGSFSRAWDRAWEKIQGTISISLKLNNVVGLTGDGPLETFLRLPGAIDLSATARFNPQRGSIDTHGFATALNIGEVNLSVDAVHSIVKSCKIKMQSDSKTALSDVPLSPQILVPPISPIFSPEISYAPVSVSSLSSEAVTLTTPHSPFLEVLSASMRPRRRLGLPVAPKLKDFKNQSLLSSLMSADVRISTIRLKSCSDHDDKYEAWIRDVHCAAKLSDAANPLHRQWLGQKMHIQDSLESDVYAFGFSMNSLVLDRTKGNSSRDHSRLVTLGSIDIEALISHWPSPLLVASSFLRGDPNAPLLVIRVNVTEVTLAERLDFLHKLLAFIKPVQKPPKYHILPSPSLRCPIPRLALDVHCGKISGRVICSNSVADESYAFELRTDGFSISALSRFSPQSLSMQRGRTSSTCSDGLSLWMNFELEVVLKATFIRVREKHPQNFRYSKLPTSALYLLDDPPLLSLETVEIKGRGSSLGVIEDEDDIVYVEVFSTFVDVHCSVDAVVIELWHATVIAAVVSLLSCFPHKTIEPSLDTTYPRLLDRLPVGCFVTHSFSRFVLFVTAPDLNPNDNLDISRGLAFRTGLSVQYCSLHTGHVQHFRGLSVQSQTRHKLYLPEEPIVEAVAAAKASPITQNSCAFLRFSFWDLSIRSAVATQYAVDDPHIMERDDPVMNAKECLRMRNVKVEICLSGKRGSAFSNTSDSCQLTMDIPYLRGEVQLVHVYSALLAFRTLMLLLRPRSPQHISPKSPNSLSYRVQGNVKTVQILFGLPGQKLAMRIDSASTFSSADGPTDIKWNSLLVWVVVPSHVNRWDDDVNERWEELGCLREWVVSLPRLGEASSISILGDSGRLRIPFGYVLADLIQAISVGIKGTCHLVRIVTAERYTTMPAPEAETAKSISNLALRVRCFSLEASDDSFESKLNLIWRAGFEASKQRLHREEAFLIKIATILAADSSEGSSVPMTQDLADDYNFSPNYSVSIEDARQRLYQVHAADWNLTHRLLKEERSRSENVTLQFLKGASTMRAAADIPNLVPVSPIVCTPPLFRVMLNGLSLNVTQPSFPLDTLPDFLHEHGKGLPRESQFSLLMPMHLSFSLLSLRVTLRDYPLPLVDIPPNATSNICAWEFDTDLVVAEEMGTSLSVDWIDCNVVESHCGIQGAAALTISIPKTIMPVKTYANPTIRVTTNGVTAFSWGVSYGAATQDLMRVIDTLSSSPRDSSPGLGFWDKMRLVFHWTIRISFKSDVHLHMKGSRDPYSVTGCGAGFALCWRGNPNLVVGHKNEDMELIQMTSDSMLIAIPKFETTLKTMSQIQNSALHERRPFQKICAKFSSGVRFGVGFRLERSCGLECHKCLGTAFHRKCRLFEFRSHYEVGLEMKNRQPVLKSPEDSYNGFRSDFIHLSISLSSSVRTTRSGTHLSSPSNLHLTPKAFAHFWSWWSLFDGVLSLPIRQGGYYPQRPLSPKFGRHLATLKYRISVTRLSITHAYIDDSRETWVDGVTSFVGVKAMINEFHADMHQRDQETTIPGQIPNTFKVLRNKPFYAAEVVLKGLDLRAMLTTFMEPLKQSVPVTSPTERSNYRTQDDLLAVDPSSKWINTDDFVETDWSPTSAPTVHLLPVMVCPRITYFKRNCKAQKTHEQSSKFGAEDTHVCLLGKEPSILQVQVDLASDRVDELRKYLKRGRQGNSQTDSMNSMDPCDQHEKMTTLLEDYIAHLREADTSVHDEAHSSHHSYRMPSDNVSSHEWSEFDNVYHIHCPKVFMDSAIRDILLRYYYCSRARRGLEYRMATRAVKFIRDQAKAALAEISETKSRSPPSGAQAAAQAFRKIIKGDSPAKSSVEGPSEEPSQVPGADDPLNGWSDGVSLWKSHFCVLLKPQIVLRSEGIPESVCVLAAVQAKLKSFAIMDDFNVEDPISGKVMSRNYSSLTGLQAFSPVSSTLCGDGCVPFEVMIDFRGENSAFDRLVPQTDAIFHYDKFNRLRLRNNVTSVGRTAPTLVKDKHLQNQTDLIQVHIPRFTVSASDQHFQAISNIVTELVLFSDAAHKTRSDKVETLLFTYDFTDLSSAANVVADLQGRLRTALETERTLEDSRNLAGDDTKLQILKIKAHIFLLAEELNFIFEAIKLAQDQMDDQTDQKSAVLLHASSSEISWRMLDDDRVLLAKLAVRAIDFSWLSRQDSSTVNKLNIGDLQAFDGSPHAIWAEILCKHNEPANHSLLKRGLFIVANWTILAPVGGITIYQEFDLNLHPMRLQIDARLGRRILEYLWPARRTRNLRIETDGSEDSKLTISHDRLRSSLDSPRALEDLRQKSHHLTPPLRTLGASQSFTDLRGSASETLYPPKIKAGRNLSSDSRRALTFTIDQSEDRLVDDVGGKVLTRNRKFGDAAEMKTRSSQKTFVLVRISSLHLLLSIMKEESFECRDASIRTRELEYRNQTWSFEELVNQFIPSDMGWRGWVKMVFHQPLVPVLPVARELISKTKWIALKGSQLEGPLNLPKLPRIKGTDDALGRSGEQRARSRSPHRLWGKGSRRKPETSSNSSTSVHSTAEPDSTVDKGDQNGRPGGRARMMSLFSRSSSLTRKSMESPDISASSSSHPSLTLTEGDDNSQLPNEKPHG